jgi:hypothetical protein
MYWRRRCVTLARRNRRDNFVGIAEAELRQVAVGWSAKREVLGQPVFNDLNERVGAALVERDPATSEARGSRSRHARGHRSVAARRRERLRHWLGAQQTWLER